MTSVRFLKIQPVLALVLTLVFTSGTGASAGPVSSAKPKTGPASSVKKSAHTLPVQQQQEEPRIVINIPSRTLWVYEGNQIVRYFPVGVGRPGFPTPVGKFSIIRKVLEPGWENPYLSAGEMRMSPGANNPLGTRWMGFLQDPGGEYGMHGTDNPTSVGKFSSHGCVRLKIPDAEALFEIVDVGTPVEVVYQPVIIRKHGDEIRVAVYADRFRRGMPSTEQVKARISKEFPHAVIDEAQLQQALSRPLEKYISVGKVVQPNSVAEHNQTTQPMPAAASSIPASVNTAPLAKERPSPALPPFHNLSNGDSL